MLTSVLMYFIFAMVFVPPCLLLITSVYDFIMKSMGRHRAPLPFWVQDTEVMGIIRAQIAKRRANDFGDTDTHCSGTYM
jgi:hypothetical protein